MIFEIHLMEFYSMRSYIQLPLSTISTRRKFPSIHQSMNISQCKQFPGSTCFTFFLKSDRLVIFLKQASNTIFKACPTYLMEVLSEPKSDLYMFRGSTPSSIIRASTTPASVHTKLISVTPATIGGSLLFSSWCAFLHREREILANFVVNLHNF